MTQTIQPPADSTPEVPLPQGVAMVDPEVGWLDGAGYGLDYRIIHGRTRTIVADVEVSTTAVQMADGTLEPRALPSQSGPSVSVHSHNEDLTSGQARELATAIFMAAAEVDSWAGGYSNDASTCTSSTTYTCASWCTHMETCQGDMFRWDQACWGPEHITVLGLDEHAPAVGRPYEYSDPHLSVFAHRRWHSLPTVRLHAYRADSDDHNYIDADFHLTAEEALKLSADLAAAAQMIGGAR